MLLDEAPKALLRGEEAGARWRNAEARHRRENNRTVMNHWCYQVCQRVIGTRINGIRMECGSQSRDVLRSKNEHDRSYACRGGTRGPCWLRGGREAVPVDECVAVVGYPKF
jgi:hypothetical protein